MKTNYKSNIFKFSIMLITALFALLFCVVLCSCSSSYSPEKKDPQITTPNIIESGKLKVGINADNPPLSGETNKLSGIDVDVASAIADELGLTVEFQDVGTNGAKALKDKQVDIVMGIDSNATVSTSKKTSNYIQTASALFSKDPNAALPTKGDSNTIAAQIASSSALAAQNQLSVSNIKLQSDLDSCFDDLEKNSVNFVAADAIKGTYLSGIKNMNATIVGLLTQPSGYCAATYEPNIVLQTKVNTTIDKLQKNGTLSVIERKWLSKNLSFDNIPLTDGAKNQASSTDIDGNVYDNIT